MPVMHRIYENLRAIDDPSVDLAMAAALATADPQATRLIALLLLERRHPQATRALLRHFDRLPDDVQATVVRHANDLYRPLREAAGEKHPATTANVLRVIRRSGSMKLAYLVTEQLRHGPATVRLQAAECLLDLARHVAAAGSAGGPGCDAVTAAFLQAAVEEAVVQYRSHEQPGVLSALAVLAPRPMPLVIRALDDWQHAALTPLREALARAEDPAFCRALLAWAGVPSLADAVVEGLGRAVEADRLPEVLELAHLVHVPAVRQAVTRLSQVTHPYLGDHSSHRWAGDRARMLPAWIMALPIKRHEQLEALANLTHHSDRTVRLAALVQLIEQADKLSATEPHVATPVRPKSPTGIIAAICTAIEPFCFDSDAAIARIALRHLTRCRWPDLPKLLLQLVNGTQQEIRQLAGSYLAPMGFDRYWNNWPRLDGQQRIAAGRALIKLDPCFHSHLGQRLSGSRDDRIRALTMIHELNQGPFFEDALLALAEDPDAHVAASAVAALGTTGSAKAAGALEAAMTHGDSRVRANAVEALDQVRAVQHVDELAAMALDEDNRPRANAIAHLLQLRSGQALTALRVMLEDDRPAHRLSALWLTEAAGLIEVARHVAELSISDADPRVRRRAGRVIQGLMHAMRDGHVGGDDPLDEVAAAAETARRSA